MLLRKLFAVLTVAAQLVAGSPLLVAGSALQFGVAAPSANAQTTSGPALARIPALDGTTFAGVRVSLPAALKDKVGVLVIGFSRGSQQSARVWGERLAQRYPDSSGVVFYEMPVVADVPSLLRGWVLSRIRQNISAPARPHFLPVLDHAAEWKQAVGAGATSDTSVLLVDAHGEVRWRAYGSVSDASFAELEEQVRRIQR